jgi:hypothetical protein
VSNCREYQKIMQSALDQTAEKSDMRRLEGHITMCNDCAREFKALNLGIDLLTSMSVREPGAGFTADTVRMAFAAKRKMLRRQKINSWSFSGLMAVASLSVIEGWNMAIRPGIKVALLNIVNIFLEWRTLLKVFKKVFSALAEYLIVSGSKEIEVLWQGHPHVFSGYVMALLIMILFILITGVKSSPFSFKRR